MPRPKTIGRTQKAFDVLQSEEEKKVFLEKREAVETFFMEEILPRLETYFELCKKPNEFFMFLGDLPWALKDDSFGLGTVPHSMKDILAKLLEKAGIESNYYGTAIGQRTKNKDDEKSKPLIPAESFLEVKAKSVTQETLERLGTLLDVENAKLTGYSSPAAYKGDQLARVMDKILYGEDPAQKIEIL